MAAVTVVAMGMPPCSLGFQLYCTTGRAGGQGGFPVAKDGAGMYNRREGGIAVNIVVLDGGTTNPGGPFVGALGAAGAGDSLQPDAAAPGGGAAGHGPGALLNRAALGREEFAQLPQLRYVGTLATGYNTFDVAGRREAGVTVCNVPHYCEDAVHSTLWRFCCACATRCSAPARRCGRGTGPRPWRKATKASPPSPWRGSAWGCWATAARGSAWPPWVWLWAWKSSCCSRTQKAAPAGCRWVDVETLFRESDVVSLHCPPQWGNPGIGGPAAARPAEAHGAAHQHGPGRAGGRKRLGGGFEPGEAGGRRAGRAHPGAPASLLSPC